MQSSMPNIEGRFTCLAVTSSSPAPFGRMAAEDLNDGLPLGPDEVVDVSSSGTCLIELPDGGRYLVRIGSGRIFGPALVKELAEDIPQEMMEAEGRRLLGLARRPARSGLLAQKLLALLALLFGILLLLLPGQFPLQPPLDNAAYFLGSADVLWAFYLLFRKSPKQAAASAAP